MLIHLPCILWCFQCFHSRFTIYKVHKASKKKREKSSAKKERKATKTLAIVLGKLNSGWSWADAYFLCSISIFALETTPISLFCCNATTFFFGAAVAVAIARHGGIYVGSLRLYISLQAPNVFFLFRNFDYSFSSWALWNLPNIAHLYAAFWMCFVGGKWRKKGIEKRQQTIEIKWYSATL